MKIYGVSTQWRHSARLWSAPVGQVRDASQAAVRIWEVTLCWDLGPVSPAHAKLLSDVLSSHLYSVPSPLLWAGYPALIGIWTGPGKSWFKVTHFVSVVASEWGDSPPSPPVNLGSYG